MSRIIMEPSSLAEGVTVIRQDMDVKSSEFRIKRVAAYCRVSTDMELQKSSLELQMETYQKTIDEHPGWELAGIYADKGLTGTKADHRVEFQRLIGDARARKVDYILAKSISRFARNTLDTLRYSRELREIGVGIFFEKERIDTMSVASEMLLTMFAAFAQEESHSISENTKRGIRSRYRMGIPKWTDTYGFGEAWTIKENEARVIRRIFQEYIEGKSQQEIAEGLNEANIPTPAGARSWKSSKISRILNNEKYVGDVAMQKSYVADFLGHVQANNSDASIEQYYRMDHHAAIVDREIYDTAHTMLAMKNANGGVRQYPYYGFFRCPECGKPMVKIRIEGSLKAYIWTCGGEGPKKMLRDRTNCQTASFLHGVLDRTLVRAVRKLIGNPLFSEEDAQIFQTVSQKKVMEYPFLRSYVAYFTVECWNTLVVTWKQGLQTKEPMAYRNAPECPLPLVEQDEKGAWSCMGFGIHQIGQFLDGFANRQACIRKYRLTSPPVHEIQIPFVQYVEEGEEVVHADSQDRE